MRINRWVGSVVLAGVVAATVLVVGTSAYAGTPPARSHLIAAAVAIPAVPQVIAVDDVEKYSTAHALDVQANATATSSVTCDGCSGAATTLQVVYASRVRGVIADNVATAWSSCANCTGLAISVQVIVTSAPRLVTAGNRSIALNVSCTGCSTSALAIQFVIVTSTSRSLSAAATAQLQSPLASLSTELRPPPVAHAAATQEVPAQPNSITAGIAALQSLISADLGASVAGHTVALKVG